MLDEERDLSEGLEEGEFAADKEIDLIDDDSGIDLGNDLDLEEEGALGLSFSGERTLDE